MASSIFAEIEYEKVDPLDGGTGFMTTHSDLVDSASLESIEKGIFPEKDYRDLLHDALDEWLENSSGTGAFYIGNVDFLKEKFSK